MWPDIQAEDEHALAAHIGSHERRLWVWEDQSAHPNHKPDLYVITDRQIVVIRRAPASHVASFGPDSLMPLTGLRVCRDGEYGRIELEQKRLFFKPLYPNDSRPALKGLTNAPQVARLISKTFNVRIRYSDYPLTTELPSPPNE